jgi:predicted esterase
VHANSALDQRLTDLSGGTPKYLKIDSASTPLASNKGLFVATSTNDGSFYYAVTVNATDVEDTTIVPGSNSLTSPVSESVMMPNPVWQESRILTGGTFEIYVQFVTKVTSSIYPQMTNVGSFPFHFAIVKSGTVSPHPVTFWMHYSGGNFLPTTLNKVMRDPNEWVITIDDWIPNTDAETGYYGLHEDYDIYSDKNPIPTSGTLYDYTSARVIHTVNWAIRNLPVDSTRTYMTGWSMGAMGSIFTAMMIPAKIAAIFIWAPMVDFAQPPVSNSGAIDWINNLWGTIHTNLPTNEGFRRNERFNAMSLARANRLNSLPIMYTFCGKNDLNVGWMEKIQFYDSLNVLRHGGFHFWSITDHIGTFNSDPWQPNFPDFSFFTRYRTNLSYPAFSNCSINDNPGNGTPLNGDQIGTINGRLDWNDDIVDLANKWEITLRVKDLVTTQGSRIAADSGITDVTLRRLQTFTVPIGATAQWENVKNNIVVQQGSFTYDGDLITIPGVRVFKASSRLKVTWIPSGVVERPSIPSEYRLEQNYPNPFNPNTTIGYGLPHRSHVTLNVYNTLGQRVTELVNEQKPAGNYTVQFDGSNLASGVYFYRLQSGTYSETKKLVLLR